MQVMDGTGDMPQVIDGVCDLDGSRDAVIVRAQVAHEELDVTIPVYVVVTDERLSTEDRVHARQEAYRRIHEAWKRGEPLQ